MSTPPTPPPAGPPPPPAPSAPQQPTSAPTATPTAPVPGASPSLNPSPNAPGTTAGSTVPPGRKPLEPLTGFRAALEHTGLPRGVLLWKPRLPSRNWCIFWTVLGTVSYLYYDDRKQCERIKTETLERVKHHSAETMQGSLDLVRKVKVYGARFPEDDDADRALRHFRKYVKPYLVAAAIDYEQTPAPLHGSITRQVHAAILAKRRQALGLEAPPQLLSLPGQLNPAEVAQRELEGGTIVVGRATLKEYMEGLKRGWLGKVDAWEWEKSVDDELKYDGVFASPPSESPATTDDIIDPAPTTPTLPTALTGSLSILSRRPPPLNPAAAGSVPDTNGQLPEYYHTPPSPLPPQAPIMLLPFTSHMGFKQIPWMIYDFFTERYRVKAGAEAALALIENNTRSFTRDDLNFDRQSEDWYKKAWAELPNKIADLRANYYKDLTPKLESVRALAKGEREMTDDEKKSTAPLKTEADLMEERRKKELRWKGQEEGWEIVQKDREVTWDDRFEEWLQVYDAPPKGSRLV